MRTADTSAAAGTSIGSITSGRNTLIGVGLYVEENYYAQPVTEPVPVAASVRFRLPPRPDLLVGRNDLLEGLAQQLSSNDREASVGASADRAVTAQTLHGLGGIGKSAVALEYCYRHLGDYTLTWWIEAEQSLGGQYAEFANWLGLGDLPPADAVQTVWHYLDRRTSWLLVFDNAPDRDAITAYIPPTTRNVGAVLVTSRNIAGWRHPINVAKLPRRVATTWLLDEGVEGNAADAEQLAAELDGLPLAIAQALAFMNANGTSLANYAEMFVTARTELLAAGQVVGYKGTVDTTWHIALTALADSCPAAIRLIELLAFVAPDRIPIDLFTPDSIGVASAKDIEEAIGGLRRYSFVDRAGNYLYIHRLVQDVVRHRARTG